MYSKKDVKCFHCVQITVENICGQQIFSQQSKITKRNIGSFCFHQLALTLAIYAGIFNSGSKAILPEISPCFSNHTPSFSVKHHSLCCHLISERPHRIVKPKTPGWESRDIFPLFNISFHSLVSQAAQILKTTPWVAERKWRRGRFEHILSQDLEFDLVYFRTQSKLNWSVIFLVFMSL